MKDPDSLERFSDDFRVVWMHYRHQAYLFAGVGFVLGLGLSWLF